MNRRALFKSAFASLTALFALKNKRLFASTAGAKSQGCKVVVFGVDGLRHDSALQLRAQGVPGLNALNPPIRNLSGGSVSVTQPGWATTWTGMPAYFHGAHDNGTYQALDPFKHIMKLLIQQYGQQDFYPVWITGKGKTIKGNIPDSPHYQIYEEIVLNGHQGVYYGDTERENATVYDLAVRYLVKAIKHEQYCCFIHFRNPDYTGHATNRYSRYLEQAQEVDYYVWLLMQMLPIDTSIIYCSDHGFNFTELGEVEDHHRYAPRGMVATNFETLPLTNVTRESVGRLIYTKAGGDPDACQTDSLTYRMYGTDMLP